MKPKSVRRSAVGEQPWSLPIRDATGQLAGRLTPVTVDDLDDRELLETLARWRNRAAGAFLTEFRASAESTERWLREQVLADPERRLLLIRSTTRLIGQLGFIRRAERVVELDGLLRGELGGHPRLMVLAERALVAWLFSEWGADEVTARVFADNAAALALHESLGFAPVDQVPLERREHDGRVQYRPAAAGRPASGRSLVRLSLARSAFLQSFEEFSR